MRSKIYTTGQVSKICNVSLATVNKWFDTGELKGFRVPGSRHRRIPRANLIEFLERHGMPLNMLGEVELSRVLVVSRDVMLIESLTRALSPERSFQVTTAASAFEAGAQAEVLRPDCIVVDFSIGERESLQICRQLRGKPALGHGLIVAVLPADCRLAGFQRSAIDETFQRPFDPQLLVERIRTVVQSSA